MNPEDCGNHVWVHATHPYCGGPPTVDVRSDGIVEMCGFFWNTHQGTLLPYTHLAVDGANRIWVSSGEEGGVYTWYEITSLKHE